MAVFKSSIRVIHTVIVGENKVRVDFKPDIVYKKECRFYTNDKKVADAIRRLPSFNTSIFEVKEAGSEKESEKEEVFDPEVKVYEDVTKTQEAIKILNKDFGVDVSTIGSKSAVKAKAKKFKVSFPNL